MYLLLAIIFILIILSKVKHKLKILKDIYLKKSNWEFLGKNIFILRNLCIL